MADNVKNNLKRRKKKDRIIERNRCGEGGKKTRPIHKSPPEV